MWTGFSPANLVLSICLITNLISDLSEFSSYLRVASDFHLPLIVFIDLIPDLPPDLIPDLPPDLTPDLLPDLIPDLIFDLIPDLPPDLTPDLIPDLNLDLIPDLLPDLIPYLIFDLIHLISLMSKFLFHHHIF